MTSRFGNSRVGALLGVALSALVGACGGGDEVSQSSPAQAVATGPTESPAEAGRASRTSAGKLPRGRAWRGITALDVASDGSLALAGADGSVALEPEGGAGRRGLAEPSGMPTTAVAFSSDGQRLVSVGRDSVARVWLVSSRTRLLSLHGHEHPIRSVAVSADGAWLASAGEETRVMLWNAGSGKLAKVFGGHASFVNAVTFSPDGRLLATGDAAGNVVIWSVINGVPRQRLAAHTDEVNGLAFSPDGRLLASAGEDGRVVLWSAEAGQKLQELQGHRGGVRAVAFSRDGAWLASGGDEARVLVWDMGTRTLARTLVSTGAVNSLVFDIRRRKDVLIAGGEDGRLARWDVARGEAR